MPISDMYNDDLYEEIGMSKRLLRSLLYFVIYNVALIVFVALVSYQGAVAIPLLPFMVAAVVVSLLMTIFFFLAMFASPFIRERHLSEWFKKRTAL
tara:strand:+ start:1896 stop:2183 length:288 start_codon:yes stop_codon:yes gene_type:complete